MSISFQFAAEADIPALVELRLAVDADQARRFGDDRWWTTISERSVARGLKSSRVLVAPERADCRNAANGDEEALGDLRHFTPVRRAVYLHDVNVEPGLQRSGIGRRLLARARTVARAWPVDAIRVDAYDGPAGGGPFYKKCGFAEVGRTVYRGVPLVYFEFVFPGKSST